MFGSRECERKFDVCVVESANEGSAGLEIFKERNFGGGKFEIRDFKV